MSTVESLQSSKIGQKMKYFICCQVFFIFIVLTETVRLDASPRLSPQLRIGRADNGLTLELGRPRLSPMFRVGKRTREIVNDEQNDGTPKRGVTGLFPFMRTGRANFDLENFNKNSDTFEDYQKMIWYYLLSKDVLEKQDITNPILTSSEKDM